VLNEALGQEDMNATDETDFSQVPQLVHREGQLELEHDCRVPLCRVLVPLRVGGDMRAPSEAVTGLCQERVP